MMHFSKNSGSCISPNFFPFFFVLCKIISIFAFRMETDNSIESQIAAVLSDIHQKGYSSVQPFIIGKVEQRMLLFAQANAVTLASDELYMSAKQLQHCMRASKNAKGLVVADIDLICFPQNRFQMDLYYEGECFIYTDGLSKFIIHPNYKMKVNREEVKLVNFSLQPPAEPTRKSSTASATLRYEKSWSRVTSFYSIFM